MSEAPRGRERRSGDRRTPRRAPTADESWFGAFGSAEDTQVSPDESSSALPPDSPARPSSSSTLDSRLFVEFLRGAPRGRFAALCADDS